MLLGCKLEIKIKSALLKRGCRSDDENFQIRPYLVYKYDIKMHSKFPLAHAKITLQLRDLNKG